MCKNIPVMQHTVTYETVYYPNVIMCKTDPAHCYKVTACVTVKRQLICVTCNNTCVIITNPTLCLDFPMRFQLSISRDCQ